MYTYSLYIYIPLSDITSWKGFTRHVQLNCVYLYIYTQTYGLHECEVNHSVKIVCLSTAMCWRRSVTISLFGIGTELVTMSVLVDKKTISGPILYTCNSTKYPNPPNTSTNGRVCPPVVGFSKEEKKRGFVLVCCWSSCFCSNFHFWTLSAFSELGGEPMPFVTSQWTEVFITFVVFANERQKINFLGSLSKHWRACRVWNQRWMNDA